MLPTPIHRSSARVLPSSRMIGGETAGSPPPGRLSTSSIQFAGACNSAIFRDSVFVRCMGVPGVIIGRHSTPLAIQHPGWHARIISRSERPRSLHVGRSDLSAWNAADLNFCRHQASGSLSLLHHSPKSASSFGKSLHFLFVRVFHALKEQHGASGWNEKVFPNPTRALVKMT